MKKGFTLAEVLITLAVIGVVATMTLPNVMANYAKKTQVAQLQRAVNATVTAAQNYLVDHKTNSLTEAGFGGDLDNFFTNYLGCTRTFGPSEAFSGQYKALNGAPASAIASGTCGSLQSGGTVCIYGWTSNPEVYVDVNGAASGPNTFGRDYFKFALTPQGRVTGSGGYVYAGKSYCSSSPYSAYAGCFVYLMENGWEMDY